jgi:hypothetical protein
MSATREHPNHRVARRGARAAEWPDPPVFDRPLVFGDSEQIEKIKSYTASIDRAKEALARCGQCDGEGMIVCPECAGSGET